MNEGDRGSHSSWPGRTIDHPHLAAEQVGYRCFEVRDFDRDVVQARSPALEEARNDTRPGCLKQLQVRIADRQHALDESFGCFRACARHSEQVGNERGRAVSPMRERDVVQPVNSPGRYRLLGAVLVRERLSLSRYQTLCYKSKISSDSGWCELVASAQAIANSLTVSIRLAPSGKTCTESAPALTAAWICSAA